MPKRKADTQAGIRTDDTDTSGAIAQLGERLNGIQEVRGSTPLGSTKIN